METIKIIVEYGGYPLRAKVPEGFYSDIAPADLGISQELETEFKDWADWYYSTLNQVYPPDSDFKSKEEKEAFISKGFELFDKLKAELKGKYKVVLYDPPWDFKGKVIE